MKNLISLCFMLFSISLYSQNAKDSAEIKLFLDSLKQGGSYLLGKQMPDFNASSLDKYPYSKKSLNKKITLINFWFESCAPCIAEMDALNSLYNLFKKNKKFQFLSFTFEKKDDIKRFATKYKIKYPIIRLTEDSCNILNFRKGYPTTIITDATGKIIYFKAGGSPNPAEAKKSIETNIHPILKLKLKNK